MLSAYVQEMNYRIRSKEEIRSNGWPTRQQRSYRSSPSPRSCRRAFALVAWARHSRPHREMGSVRMMYGTSLTMHFTTFRHPAYQIPRERQSIRDKRLTA